MINKNNSALVVIDYQEKLLPKIKVADKTVKQGVKLIRFARELSIPVIVTEQYPTGLGNTCKAIASEIEGTTPLEKMTFGCMGDDAFRTALEETGRKQLIVTGVETHVCVMQTVLAAVKEDFDVFVPMDAVAARKKGEHKAGLRRMEAIGAHIVTTEMAMFEALRIAGTSEFKQVLPILK